MLLTCVQETIIQFVFPFEIFYMCLISVRFCQIFLLNAGVTINMGSWATVIMMTEEIMMVKWGIPSRWSILEQRALPIRYFVLTITRFEPCPIT